jgi:hypothetical protein
MQSHAVTATYIAIYLSTLLAHRCLAAVESHVFLCRGYSAPGCDIGEYGTMRDVAEDTAMHHCVIV